MTKYKNQYLSYIKSNITIYSEKKKVDTDILLKKQIINNKVEKLEKKIERHNSFLQNRLKIIVEKKLTIKIKHISKNKNFNKLSDELKVLVLDKTIIKIKKRIKNF